MANPLIIIAAIAGVAALLASTGKSDKGKSAPKKKGQVGANTEQKREKLPAKKAKSGGGLSEDKASEVLGAKKKRRSGAKVEKKREETPAKKTKSGGGLSEDEASEALSGVFWAYKKVAYQMPGKAVNIEDEIVGELPEDFSGRYPGTDARQLAKIVVNATKKAAGSGVVKRPGNRNAIKPGREIDAGNEAFVIAMKSLGFVFKPCGCKSKDGYPKTMYPNLAFAGHVADLFRHKYGKKQEPYECDKKPGWYHLRTKRAKKV